LRYLGSSGDEFPFEPAAADVPLVEETPFGAVCAGSGDPRCDEAAADDPG